ncbi:NYN domain-containing protein [Elongatibacter sediminis]|uniref:NYN domain-containing protein n=1 Tax=Elongatibacter sediminis TaxID=3119006 RepID=A0AAW9RKY1_9GAMM
MKEFEGHYLFVDGAYLDKVLASYADRFYQGKAIEIDYRRIIGGHERCFYYDCPVQKKSNQSKAAFQEDVQIQLEKFQKIASTKGVHLFTGQLRGRDSRIRQKGIDVKMAVDMFSHAIRKNMTHATLLSGDLDFYPIVDALVDHGIFVTLYCDKKSASQDLIRAADDKQFFSPWSIFRWISKSMTNPPIEPIKRKLILLPNIPVIKTGSRFDGKKVYAYRQPDGYSIAYPQGASGDYCEIRHPDFDIALNFVELEIDSVSWNESE